MVDERKVIIFGTGKIAEVAYAYLERSTKITPFRVRGFTQEETTEGQTFKNLPVISFSHVQYTYPSDDYDLFIAVSYLAKNKIRERIFTKAKIKGYHLRNYTCSGVHVGVDTSIGEGCWILEKNNIQHYTTIGYNCILWSGNHIGHHCKIGNHVFISSHVVVSGNCTIGNNTFIGVNSTIIDGINIGHHCTIGAGALIVADVPDHQVVKGKWGKKELKVYEHIFGG